MDDRKAIYPLTACVSCMFADAAREGHAEAKSSMSAASRTIRDAAREGHAEAKSEVYKFFQPHFSMQPARVTLRQSCKK